MRGCNCLPEWKVTDNPSGAAFGVSTGNCSHTDNLAVPWCLVLEDTCSAGPFHLSGGEAWDSCVDRSAPDSRSDPRTTPCCSCWMRRGGTRRASEAASAAACVGKPTVS